MYLEILVHAWSFWLGLEHILIISSLKPRSLSVLTLHNTSSLLAFVVDPIVFIGLSTNELSKTWNFPGLALKPLWWNHYHILDISVSSLYLFPDLCQQV